MAEKRMFAKTIIDSDAFLDMSISAQALYFHLCMRADDEGFVNAPKKIMRMVGCNDDDLKVLVVKSFIIPFESGVIVIKHWKMHNYLRADRIKPTVYETEKQTLFTKSNKAYTQRNPYENGEQMALGSQFEDVDFEVQEVESDEVVTIDGQLTDKCPHRLDKISIDIYCRDVIDYLNERLGTKYRPDTGQTVKDIKREVKAGYTVDDFKRVIDYKIAMWKGTENEQYLRPSTLFRQKNFSTYLEDSHNQKWSGQDKKVKEGVKEVIYRDRNGA
jgi:uncharacterized phage protein (TIGR02220 family)